MKVIELIRKYGAEALLPIIGTSEILHGNSNVFFVDSGHTYASDANDGEHGMTWDKPFATIDYAVGFCTASNGDIILVAPGHAENISAATSLVLDVAGVAIIGLGRGSLIPKLSFTALAGTISVTAADCKIKNIWLYGNATDGITAAITAAATADGLVLEDILVTEAANTKEFLTGFTFAALCQDVWINRLRYINMASTDTLAAITFAGATASSRITNSFIMGNMETAAILASAAAGTGIFIADNVINNLDASLGVAIGLHSGTTGAVVRNHIVGGKDGTAPITAAGCLVSQNYSSNAMGASGIILPAVDS